MKAIEPSKARYLARTALAPFSYYKWRTRERLTIIPSTGQWVNDEWTCIELPAAQYLETIQYNAAYINFENVVKRLSNIALSLKAVELYKLTDSLQYLADEANRYEKPTRNEDNSNE